MDNHYNHWINVSIILKHRWLIINVSMKIETCKQQKYHQKSSKMTVGSGIAYCWIYYRIRYLCLKKIRHPRSGRIIIISGWGELCVCVSGGGVHTFISIRKALLVEMTNYNMWGWVKTTYQLVLCSIICLLTHDWVSNVYGGSSRHVFWPMRSAETWVDDSLGLSEVGSSSPILIGLSHLYKYVYIYI